MAKPEAYSLDLPGGEGRLRGTPCSEMAMWVEKPEDQLKSGNQKGQLQALFLRAAF